MASNGIQTLDHLIALLDCFTVDQPELGVREAARLTGLTPSTAGRVMAALKEAGVLRQNPETRAYGLGAKVLAWADAYSAALDIRKLALPFMQDLQRSTQETISLYVLEGYDRVCVERLESKHNVRVVARIGRRLPLYAGSAGKLMLAFLPETRQNEILNAIEMKPYTPQTVTDPEALRLQLRQIRRQGYADSIGEWITEAAGVAAPVLNGRGDLQAALTISGPAQRFSPEVVQNYAVMVMKVAAQISKELGFAEVM
jgi:DNA-binding IclR family transcriptional regulator